MLSKNKLMIIFQYIKPKAELASSNNFYSTFPKFNFSIVIKFSKKSEDFFAAKKSLEIKFFQGIS